MTELNTPPRVVGFRLKGAARFGGAFNYIGWGMMLFGLIFSAVFILQSELVTMFQFRGTLTQAKGVITTITQTSSEVNNEYIFKIGYNFQDKTGETFSGVSYEADTGYKRGDVIVVEYREDDPAISRVKGLRSAAFPWQVVFVGIVPLIGLIFIVIGFKKGGKIIRLLQKGHYTVGTYLRREGTSTRINNQRVYRYIYQFEDNNGVCHNPSGNTHREDWFEKNKEQTGILYDQRHPENGMIFSLLPGKITIDPRGNPVSNSIGWIIIPCATGIILFILSQSF